MIRVAFILNDYPIQWKGGLNYYRSLINAVVDLPDSPITPVIVTTLSVDGSVFKGFPDVEIIRSSVFERFHPSWFLQRTFDRLLSQDVMIERLLRKNRIDFLSHSNFALNAGSSVPMCTWIPDFQIAHMPEFFSPAEIDKMSHEFNRLSLRSTRVIVSSYQAQKDLADFAPEFVSKSRVLQFVARPQFNAADVDLATLQQKYKFDPPYFLVPNQFWVHKNHKILVEALRILKDNGQEVLILATGKQHDLRQPYYNTQLSKYVDDVGVSRSFRALGEIPYADLSCLMLNSISMINPSFFEGWSTSVEEAKSLGKHVILSDIPVHREQAPHNAIFFDPRNANELARILWSRAMSFNLQEDHDQMNIARENFRQRWTDFGQTYCDIVMDALQ